MENIKPLVVLEGVNVLALLVTCTHALIAAKQPEQALELRDKVKKSTSFYESYKWMAKYCNVKNQIRYGL